jgi:signal transduction histidine kinase
MHIDAIASRHIAASAAPSSRALWPLFTPRFDDPETERNAGLLQIWILSAVIISALMVLINLTITRVNMLNNTMTFGTAAVLSAILLIPLRRGYVRLVGALVVFGTIAFTIFANIMAHRPFAIGTSSGFLTLMLAGIFLTKREFAWAAVLAAAAVTATGAYWLGIRATPEQARYIWLDMAVYVTYSIGVGTIVYITTGHLRRAMDDAMTMRRELAVRNASLMREATIRQKSERRQQQLTGGLQSIVHGTSILLQCESLGDLWSSAVDLARRDFGLGMCAIYYPPQTGISTEGRWTHGTLSGERLDENAIDLDRSPYLHQQQLSELTQHRGFHVPGWRVRGYQSPNGARWISETPIVDGHGELLALFFHAPTQPGTTPDPDQQDLLTLFSSMLGRIAERKVLEIENAMLHRSQLHAAAVEERSRLSRELHDSVSQSLFGIVLGVRTIKQNGLRDDNICNNALDYVFTLSEAALSDMRALVLALRPEAIENEGFLVAFQRQISLLSKRCKECIRVALGTVEPDVPLVIKESLYRIGSEALQNAINHANAAELSVELRQSDTAIELSIADNGEGFDVTQQFKGHWGLQTMRERAEMHNGQLLIDSKLGAGTRVTVRFPMTEA